MEMKMKLKMKMRMKMTMKMKDILYIEPGVEVRYSTVRTVQYNQDTLTYYTTGERDEVRYGNVA